MAYEVNEERDDNLSFDGKNIRILQNINSDTHCITLSADIIERAAKLIDKYHNREDIMQRFENEIEKGTYREELLDDSELIEKIVTSYSEAYQNAMPGGEECDVRHWSYVLGSVLYEYRHELSKYCC